MVDIPYSPKTNYSEASPTIRALALGSPIRCILMCRARWGPIAGETIGGVKQKYVESASWAEWRRVFGGFDSDHPGAKYAYWYFQCGGQTLYTARTAHFTDPTDPATVTAARSTYQIKSTQATQTYGTVTSSNTAPFDIADGDTLDFKVDGGATDTATFNATAATVTDMTSYPVTGGTGTLSLKVDQETVAQDITFAGTETTADQIAATINANLVGAKAEVSGGQVVLTSDKSGTGSYIQVTANPSAHPLLTFPTSEQQGTGDAADIDAITIAEIKTVVEGDVSGVTVTDNGDGTFSVATNTAGSSGSIQVEATSTADDEMGLDNSVHAGVDTSQVNAATADGKYYGTRGDDVSVTVATATSGVAAEFDVLVLESSVQKERFFSLTYDTAEDIVNDTASGSDLITWTKDGDYRPDNGTYTLTGGDDGLTSIDNADYAGDADAGTGIRCFDSLTNFRVALTDREDYTHVKAFQDYLGTTRKAIGLLLYDVPYGYSYSQARTYNSSNGLKGYGEFGADFWPYANAPNPDKSVFGSALKEVPMPASAGVAGRAVFASAQHDAGFSDEPAGRRLGRFDYATGITDEDANKESVRDKLYPDLINPIRSDEGVVFNDGVLVNKVDGNFPTIAQRITACETAHRILNYLDAIRHKGMDDDFYKEAYRNIERILTQRTKAGAYASKIPNEAFYIDFSANKPSLRRKLRCKVKVGIATKDPNEFTDLELGYDERGLIYEEVVAA
jgi:hypothetical protein